MSDMALFEEGNSLSIQRSFQGTYSGRRSTIGRYIGKYHTTTYKRGAKFSQMVSGKVNKYKFAKTIS